MRARLLLFALVAVLALVAGFVTFTPLQALWLVQHLGYWIILAGAAAFVVTLVAVAREDAASRRDWRAALWAERGPLLAILLGTVFLHVHEEHGYKIVMDEVVLQGTAFKMHFGREVGTAMRAYDLGGNFALLSAFVDKRPLFFPFLVSLVHDLTGYRVANGVVLNALLTPVLLTLGYLVGRRMHGRLAGVTVVLLLTSVPLLAQSVASSGFEALNLLMILLTLWLGMRYADRPTDARLGAFVSSAVLLAQVRYESVLFLGPVGATILFVWWRQRRVALPWPLLAAPLLLIVYPWQYNVFKLAPAAWQLRDRPEAGSPFGLEYFYDNVGHALNFFFSTDGSQGNSLLVAVVGVVGIGFAWLLVYRRHRELFARDPAMAVLCIFLATLFAHGLLMLCYFYGQFDDPIIRRLSLPSHLLMILAFVFVWPELLRHRLRWRAMLVVTGLYILTFTSGHASRHLYDRENYATRTTNWLSEFAAGLGNRRILAIDGIAHLQWILHRQSSIPFRTLASRVEGLLYHFERRTFDDIYVVQHVGVDPATGRPLAALDEDFGPAVTLELVEQRRFAPAYIVRLSRIVAIDPDGLRAWAKAAPAVEQQLEAQLGTQRGPSLDYEEWVRQLP